MPAAQRISSADQRADAATSSILLSLLTAMRNQIPGTLSDEDPECLHRFRVAVRRSRTMQRELPGVFPPERLREFQDEFRRLQQVTGPLRDLDVQIVAIESAQATTSDLEPLLAVLRDHRETERVRTHQALSNDHTGKVLDEWEAFLVTLPESPVTGRPDATLPIRDLVSKRTAKLYRKMARARRDLSADSPSEKLHELRKQGKELRYLLELFSDLYPKATIKPMVASLKSVQDALGRFHDDAVQMQMLQSIGEELVNIDHGAATLTAIGRLVERLGTDKMAARTEFDHHLDKFAAKEMRVRAKQAFKLNT